MNTNLRNAVRNLAASQGAALLLDVRRVEENLPVFAGKEANAERKLFIEALASGLPGELQKCPDQAARLECKKGFARKLAAGQGFPVPLIKEIFDLIEELLCAAVSRPGNAVPYPPAAPAAPGGAPVFSVPSAAGLGSKQVNGMAIAALVISIIGVLCLLGPLFAILPSILAIIFGALGRQESVQTNTGRGMATFGLITGIITLVLSIVIPILQLVFLVSSAVQGVSDILEGSEELLDMLYLLFE